MSGLVSAIRDELENKEFREAYVAENARRGLAYQIRALRDAKRWSRAEFARQAHRPQSNVTRWEDPTYGKFSLSTLIEIASVFDVGLSVQFVSFGELLTSVANRKPEKLAVPSYDAERQLVEQQPLGSSALAAFAEPPKQHATNNLVKLLLEPPKAGSPLPSLPLTNGTHAAAAALKALVLEAPRAMETT